MLKYENLTIHKHPKVYEPAEDSFLLADNLQVERRDRVLEIGTGTGILAIMASRKCREVVATDINPHALECATKNLIANKAYNVELRAGDLFEAARGEKFDLIIFNTPYLPVEEEEGTGDDVEAAWSGGEDGREVIDRFIDGLNAHLNEKGRVQLLQSSLSKVDKTLTKMGKKGFDVSVTARQKLFFEEIVVITGLLPKTA